MKPTADKPTAPCGAELTQLCGLTTPRAVGSPNYHFFLYLLLLFYPQCGQMVLNLLKYECCFLTSEIFFNSPPYTHTHTHTHTQKFFHLFNPVSFPKELKN